jgi:endonuclease/exonuclease/phosphatase family metal-dependent hydrolase
MKLLNIIAFPATVVLGLLLMVSGLVPSISPATNSWLPLLGLAFPVFFLLMSLLFLFWLIQRKWRSLFALSCLLLNLGQASLYVQWNDTTAEEKALEDRKESLDEVVNFGTQTFKVASYNAQLFGLYNDESSVGIVNTEYMPAMDSFLRVLKAESADVVCLQEVYAKAGGLKLLSRFLKAEGGYDYSQSYTLSANRPYGMLVLSKYKIKRWQPISFGPNTGNMAMWVDVEVTDSQYQRKKPRIRIYNLHLQSFRFAKQDYAVMQKQTKQQQLDIEGSKGIITRLRLGYERRAEQVNLVKESMLACDFPKIVCGDFNDIPVSYTYRELSAGMKDAFGEAGRGLETTYKGSMPSFRIDYILFDNPMRAIHYESVAEVPSDHKWIAAKLQIGGLFQGN